MAGLVSFQVGAFSVLDNAHRLEQELSRKDLNTYYSRHDSGLYKIQFGDFSSREAACQEVELLLSESVIKDYFTVRP